MQSKAEFVDDYINELPLDRKEAVSKIRNEIKRNLPNGFKECMSYGMIGYVVPHDIYPSGYHCNPKLPLPFINIASQKNFIALYHMAFYSESIVSWFKEEFEKVSIKKLDMGKCCVRFKNTSDIPYRLIGELATKITPEKWIEIYESGLKKTIK
jgi:uncharacterized protein YdhG (YjbR/CyaY superfamily)